MSHVCDDCGCNTFRLEPNPRARGTFNVVCDACGDTKMHSRIATDISPPGDDE